MIVSHTNKPKNLLIQHSSCYNSIFKAIDRQKTSTFVLSFLFIFLFCFAHPTQVGRDIIRGINEVIDTRVMQLSCSSAPSLINWSAYLLLVLPYLILTRNDVGFKVEDFIPYKSGFLYFNFRRWSIQGVCHVLQLRLSIHFFKYTLELDKVLQFVNFTILYNRKFNCQSWGILLLSLLLAYSIYL